MLGAEFLTGVAAALVAVVLAEAGVVRTVGLEAAAGVAAARDHAARAGLGVVRARLAAEAGLGVGALAVLRAAVARHGAGGPGTEASDLAVDGAREGVAGARLGVVRAGLAAERGLDLRALALLRAGAARLGARGVRLPAVGDAVHRAWAVVA